MLPTQWSRDALMRFPFKFKNFPTIQTRSSSSFSSLLDFCNNKLPLQQIHARFILYGYHQNPTLSSKLIDCYANLGYVDSSERVFASVKNPNVLLYNTILRNLYKCGKSKRTLLLYREMLLKFMYPDEFTYPFVIKSCLDLSDIETGRQIHCHAVKLGFDSDVFVGNSLVEMYEKYNDDGGNLAYCNLLIAKSTENGRAKESFWLFHRMRMEELRPNSVSVIALLRSSVDLSSLAAGRFVHLLIVVSNLGRDLSVNTALLTMYSKLGSLETARLLFDKMPERDCVVWNLMISAYSRSGYPEESLELLIRMVKSGVRADLFTAIAVISSVADLKCLEQGKQIHAHVIRNGADYQVSVHNCLIDMYGRCGNLKAARKIFDLVLNKTVVSWSSMIKGYVTHEQSCDALSLFTKMKMDGVRPDSITVINLLPACVNIGALEQVNYLHGFLIKQGLNSMTSVVTAFLISYAKCGCIGLAQKLFDEEAVDVKDIVSWNAMISAYSKHGNWSKCFELYLRMKNVKLRPDLITFLGLLTACVNSGMVKEGRKCFKEMTEIYGCRPNQEHYACMVDLLGRAGHIKEASELIKTMPSEPDAQVWGSLLSACKMHSDAKAAEFAAEKLIAMEPKNAGNYILLSNIYAAAGKWDAVAKMRWVLRARGLKKNPGCSWLEINGRVHEFRVADQSHPKREEIYTVLGNIESEIKVDKDLTSELSYYMPDLCTLSG